MGGDFNVVKFMDKRRGGDGNDSDREKFNQFIQKLQLLDLPIIERNIHSQVLEKILA